MVFLILLFLIISPIVILYTIGYRYDFASHTVRQTGAISIEVEPKNAQVYINDIYFNEKMPIELTNRTPGIYSVRLEQEGYKTWEKDITVESNGTTYIRNISLIKDEIPAKVLIRSELSSVHGTPSSKSILSLQKNIRGYELVSHSPENETMQTIETFSTTPEIHASPFSSIALTLSKTKSGTLFTLFDTKDTKKQSVKNIPLTSQHSYQWNKKEKEVYINIDSEIEMLDIDGNNKTIGSVSSTEWFVEYPRTIWAIQDSVLLLQNNPEIAYSIPKNTEQIIDITKERIVLKTSQDIVLIHRNKSPEEAITRLPAHSWSFNTEKNVWWVWSDFELWSIYDDGGFTLVERSSNKIDRVLPFDTDDVTLIIDAEGGRVFNPGLFPTQDVFNANNINWASTNPEERILYFTRTEEDKLELYKLNY